MQKIMFLQSVGLNKLFQALALLFVLCAGGIAQTERSWKTYSPPDGAWSILAPGAMRADEEAQEPNSKKGSYSYYDFAGFFAVIYRDSPRRLVPWKPNYKSYFKKIRNDAVEAAKGELLKDEEFSNGGATGREVYIKVPSGTSLGAEGQTLTKYRIERMRMFFHEKRFYLLVAVLPEEDINTPAVNNYFNSFVAK